MVPMLDLWGKELETKLLVLETTDVKAKVTIFLILHPEINFRIHSYPPYIYTA
jgi:hypothetical protein